MYRALVSLIFIFLVVALSFPKEKKQNGASLPADILRARTVMVVIAPNAGEPLHDPQANARAQDDVEKYAADCHLDRSRRVAQRIKRPR